MILMSTSSSSTSSKINDELKALRKELTSVAWVQCDNLTCLKWRKIKSEDAEKLTDTTPWQCSLNKDRNFNRCDIEQEDTSQYDHLAKKAKLCVIKSDLKPGSLVRAKTKGYCSWPALITKDPANGEYCQGDEIEILWYHVEYIGGQRCHGWVRSSFVEVFGLDQSQGASAANAKPAIYTNPQRKKIKRKKRLLTDCGKSHHKERTTYKRQQTLQEAHKEALELLPLSLNARLKSCVFKSGSRQMNWRQKHIGPKSRQKKTKMQEMKDVNRNFVARKPFMRSKEQRRPLKSNRDRQRQATHSEKGEVNVSVQKSPVLFCLKSKATELSSHVKHNEIGALDEVLDEEMMIGDLVDQENHVFRLEPLFNFSTSLIDVSKEIRLMEDTKKYKTQSLLFETNLTNFFSNHGVPHCKAPIWCQLKIDLFEFVLTVMERGGFSAVSANHQWSIVYQELTSQSSKDGGSKTKAFYKRYSFKGQYGEKMFGGHYNLLCEDLNIPMDVLSSATTAFAIIIF